MGCLALSGVVLALNSLGMFWRLLDCSDICLYNVYIVYYYWGLQELGFSVDKERWSVGVLLRLQAIFRHAAQTSLNNRTWFPQDPRTQLLKVEHAS